MTDVALLKKEAKSKKTPALRLEELAGHPDSSVQLAVAGNPNTPPTALEYLGRSAKLSLLKAVAKHGNTPIFVLERLARHQQVAVRSAVGESPVITEAVALLLLSDLDERVRYAALPNSGRIKWNTSGLVDLAAKDSSSLVRTRAAECCTDPDVLQHLLDDPTWIVVAGSLGNRLLEITALTVALEQHFEPLNEATNHLTAARIVQRSDLPVQWLERFSNHPNAAVRFFIAMNPNTPRSLLSVKKGGQGYLERALTEMMTSPELPQDV